MKSTLPRNYIYVSILTSLQLKTCKTFLKASPFYKESTLIPLEILCQFITSGFYMVEGKAFGTYSIVPNKRTGLLLENEKKIIPQWVF